MRRVLIEGTCPKEAVPDLRALIWPADGTATHALCGSDLPNALPDWSRETIDAVGHLATAAANVDGVVTALQYLRNQLFGLSLKVHVGAEDDGDVCVATVTLEGGEVSMAHPTMTRVPAIRPLQAEENTRASMADAGTMKARARAVLPTAEEIQRRTKWAAAAVATRGKKRLVYVMPPGYLDSLEDGHSPSPDDMIEGTAEVQFNHGETTMVRDENDAGYVAPSHVVCATREEALLAGLQEEMVDGMDFLERVTRWLEVSR